MHHPGYSVPNIPFWVFEVHYRIVHIRLILNEALLAAFSTTQPTHSPQVHGQRRVSPVHLVALHQQFTVLQGALDDTASVGTHTPMPMTHK